MDSRFNNYAIIANEVVLLISSYIVLLFSQYVPTETQKFDLGYAYLFLLAVSTAFNILIAGKLFLIQYKEKLKKREFEKNLARRKRVRELKKPEQVEQRAKYRQELVE